MTFLRNDADATKVTKICRCEEQAWILHHCSYLNPTTNSTILNNNSYY